MEILHLKCFKCLHLDETPFYIDLYVFQLLQLKCRRSSLNPLRIYSHQQNQPAKHPLHQTVKHPLRNPPNQPLSPAKSPVPPLGPKQTLTRNPKAKKERAASNSQQIWQNQKNLPLQTCRQPRLLSSCQHGRV